MSSNDAKQEGSTNRERQSHALLRKKSNGKSNKFCELAGGTAAECAAVCCCPCALLNLTVLIVIKLPIGLLKKAIAKKRRSHAVDTKKRRSHAVDTKKSGTRFVGEEEYQACSDEPSSSVRELLQNNGNIAALHVDTEDFWDAVTGESYVGFWRNYPLGE